MGTFDATINDLIEVSAVDRYTVIAPGRYRVMLQADGGAELIRLDRDGKFPIRLTPTQWGLLDETKFVLKSPGSTGVAVE